MRIMSSSHSVRETRAEFQISARIISDGFMLRRIIKIHEHVQKIHSRRERVGSIRSDIALAVRAGFSLRPP